MYLPSSVSTQWYVQTYRQPWLNSAPADASGVCQVQLDQVPDGELWMLERIVVSNTSSTLRSQARLYLDQVDPHRLIDGTRSGNFDTADQASPIQLPAGTVLLCQWTGADVGSIGSLRAQLVVLRQR